MLIYTYIDNPTVLSYIFFLHPLVKRLLAEHSLHQPHSRQRKPGRQWLRPHLHLCERGRHDQHISSAGCAM